MVNAGTVLFFVSAVFGAIAVFLARSGHLGKEHLVGIDLGTTYSVVAVNRHGNVTVMPDVHGHFLLPSVVAFKPNGGVLVGRDARHYRRVDPKHTISNAKRFIGRQFDESIAAEAALYDFPLLANTTGDSHVCFGLNLPGHPSCISPVDIGYYVVKALKETAMAFLGHDQIYGAVIAIPAGFDASQRKATVAAFERAGLKVRNVLVEPTAAALAYGLHTKPNVHYVLVFDFGGGTLDVSLLYLQNGSFQVMDTAGDNHLGGEDLDDLLSAHLKHEFEQVVGGHSLPDVQTSGDMPDVFPCTAAGVRGVAEQLKRRLSFANDGEASCVVQQAVGEYVVGDTLRLRMTRAEWEELCLPTLQRTMEPVKEVLVGNMMTAGDVDEVVLVGGSSRIPWIQGQLTEMFGRAPNGHIDPDVAVAVGAARLAH
ncbi:hypothetical protein H310_12260 [Aphanomyces invadans]|uniref:Hsp70-like protein n=1 Tax=Aphanomyces invadans TaxID=157072 RepID=A0A024TK05_9STRA|nr:hypothetical protein H310_12260 [Aphanomyces invadans]ETV93916.1 hypothetical protein H310_12260 [Aphanomyces invadans]|eukprot:XP_008877476.1 hypothetical protein H310_12260 [Aphanomyces invadans]